MIAKLKKVGVEFRGIYYCPDHPQAEIESYRCDCVCRKPNPGLLKMAAFRDRLDLVQSYIIGDKLSDLSAGKTVAAKTALVLTGYGLQESAMMPSKVLPDFIGPDLQAIAEWIIIDQRKLKQIKR